MAVEENPHPNDQVERFVALFDGQDPRLFIRDLQAEVVSITINGQSLPISLSHRSSAPNCYLCSPTVAYIDYALEETRALDQSRIVKWLASTAIRACAPLVRAAGLDTQVQVNNWLVSTNPIAPVSEDMARAIRDKCLADHPTHSIVLRSLNDVLDQSSIDALKSVGFKMLAARQIYVQPKATAQRRDVKRDVALLEKTDLEIVDGSEFSFDDFERCEALYRALYLDKYTALNPHYTAAFLAGLQRAHVMQFKGLRDRDGRLVGFTGLFERAGVLTQPFVGYDTTQSQDAGVYRMLMAMGREYAQTHDLRLNLSAGAAGFKRNRGAVAAIEYTAVYVAHLPAKNRIATSVLEAATRTVGIPLVRRFEL